MNCYLNERRDLMNKLTLKAALKLLIVLMLSNGIGFSLSLRYDGIHWISALILLILTTGIFHIDYILTLKLRRKIIGAIACLALPLIYFSLRYSPFTLMLFSAIILLFSLRKHFFHFDMLNLFHGIESFIIIVVLNSFSFYIQTYFFNSTLTVYLISIYLVYLSVNKLGNYSKQSEIVD